MNDLSFGLLHEIEVIDQQQPIQEVKFPFSVPLMDESHEFGSTACQEMKDYIQKQYDIKLDKLYIVAILGADVKPIENAASFESQTNLKVIKQKDKHIGLLVLGYEEKRS